MRHWRHWKWHLTKVVVFLLYKKVLPLNYYMHSGWRSGLVVTTSVFGWRTLRDLRLIYG